MMYNYQAEKVKIFTEEGQIMFLSIRDNVDRLLSVSGAVMMNKAINGVNGDSFVMLACVDRLVEIGEIRELNIGHCAGQHRVFVRGQK